MSFRALAGFRDFYPVEMAMRRHIEGAWHAASKAAGFEEIDGPPLESLDLFKAKSGDAIVEQLYAFVDKGERDVALRAEFTPSLARMVGAKAASLRQPIKWYCVPQLFRYERQQRGRLREHFQWNVDIMGSNLPSADAELLSVGLDGLRRLGLTSEHIYVRVNHRAVVERKLLDLGFAQADLESVLRFIDKEELKSEKAVETLDPARREALIAWMKEPVEPEGELAQFLEACRDYGIEDYVEVDRNIVRGLAYYTGIVFEIFDRQRSLRAVAGGGRYDGLIEKLGGPAMPAVGFGMGDVVLGELLKEKGLLPPDDGRLDDLVVPIGDDMLGAARQVVRRLRDAGRRAEAPLTAIRMGKAFKAAEAAGAERVVVVGPDEWANQTVQVKTLATGEQEVTRLEDLA
jgi:histidyl-tRNA synthetase